MVYQNACNQEREGVMGGDGTCVYSMYMYMYVQH